MTTAERFERGYLLQLLRDGNAILRELQQGIVTVPSEKTPKRSLLSK